jgi:hypothetical protein
LIWATFQILIAPTKISGPISSSINISKEYKLNGAGNTWVDTTGLGVYLDPLACSDAVYTFSYELPSNYPHMGIEHDGGFGPAVMGNPGGTPASWPVTWGPYPPYANGTSGFNALLYIKNLDPAWGLWNASFTLTYNSTVIDVLGGTANITLDSNWPSAEASITYSPGTITIYVENYTGTVPPLPNKVLVATVKFTVMIQGASPPLPPGYYDDSLLTYSIPAGYGNYYFYDLPSPGGNQPIPHTAPDQGEAIVLPVVSLPLPYLKVVPASTVLGPAPVIGSTFSVDIQIVNMSMYWYDVLYQFRLQYDSDILSLVSVTEGPWMTNPIWNKYGTFFWSINYLGDPMFGDHVAVVDMLLPNGNGVWNQTIFPNTIENSTVNPTVATATFMVVKQNCFGLPDIDTFLKIPAMWLPSDCIFVDKDSNYIPSAPCQNGTVTIKAINEVERQIDLVGGAVNDGYGVLPLTWPFPYPAPDYYLPPPYYLAFPTPYGGQGPDHWMDLVFPQSWVYLNAYVSYNYWPVQSKDVGFEIEGPFTKLPNGTLVPAQSYQIWAKLTATTDSNGVATLMFRMPWPCLNPDSITGIWKITAGVTVADVQIHDTMIFYYERLVYITSVTTDSYSYIHEQNVKVTVNYQTHSVQKYNALFAVVIADNLTVPFGMALVSATVGGATFCTWKTAKFTVEIYIPKWAYAGNASVLVSVYDKDPTIGGEALAPEFKPDPIINIYPY